MPRRAEDATPRSPLFRWRLEQAQVTSREMATLLGMAPQEYAKFESGDVPLSEALMRRLKEYGVDGKDLERQHRDFREARLSELKRVVKARLGLAALGKRDGDEGA
jgi:transcriptional regulator with XRE-family HTH domain